ncbi:hypothetical protein RFI_04749, partial [Reticulomyxa filosa]
MRTYNIYVNIYRYINQQKKKKKKRKEIHCIRGRPSHIEVQTSLSEEKKKYSQKKEPQLIKIQSVRFEEEKPKKSKATMKKLAPSGHYRIKSNYVTSLQSLGGPLELQSEKYKNEHVHFIHLSDIHFVMEGHWTPNFLNLSSMNASHETLTTEDTNTNTESLREFFHRDKSFSIVTKAYKTYELVCFHPSTRNRIVKTIRSLIYQTPMQAKSLAIFAQANRKYLSAQKRAVSPLGVHHNLDDLEFNAFVT